MKNNWEIKTLGEVCEVIAGGDVPKNDYSKIKTKEHRIPIFTNGEKNKGLYGFTSMPRINKSSITISARGTIGYIELRDEPFYPAIRLISATPKDDNINILFLRHAIGRLIINSSGTSIPQLTVPMMKNYEIPIPPIKEQEEIVERLDKGFELIDSLKETAKKNLDNAKELFQSVLREELSPKEGWESKKLGEVCEYIKEQGIYNNLPYIGMEDIESKTMRFTGSKEIKKVLSNTFRFTNDLILFGRLRPYLCKIYEPDFEGHCSTEIFPIKTTKYIDKSYLKYWLFQDSIIEKINDTCTGARMPRANMNTVLEFEITFPKEGQKDIVNRLDRIKGYCEELEGNYKRVLELCEELKQGLLREAFEVK